MGLINLSDRRLKALSLRPAISVALSEALKYGTANLFSSLARRHRHISCGSSRQAYQRAVWHM
jgi:hypothetical protein